MPGGPDGTRTTKARILLVEDPLPRRQGLAGLIDDGEPVTCAGAETIDEAVRVACERSPDIVIIDLGADRDSGLELIKRMRDAGVRVPVLVLQAGSGANGRDAASPLRQLSEREFEVFDLIGQGIGPSEIARRLGVSVKTIETHRERIKQKLGLSSGAQLMKLAFQLRA